MEGSSFNFDIIAEYYDSWYDNPVGNVYDIYEKKAMAKLLPPASPGSTLFEVGSGTGHWSAWFTEMGYQVTGIDVSPAMTRRAESRGIPGSCFIEGDFLTAPIRGSFDVVAAVTSLEFIPDYRDAVIKMSSLLRPGGLIIVGVLNSRSWLGVERKIKGVEDPVYHSARFFTTGEIRELLSSYGKPHIIGSTFVLPYRAALPAAGVMESIGSFICPCLGNFISGSVRI
ncbi:MAG: class I SAM-dependent methyltransferase [Spirochaetota bacterium]